MRQFAVIGLGRFGQSLARALSEMDCEVLAVDSDPERVEEIQDAVTQAVQADATEERTLRELGLRNFDVVVVAIGHDLQASILITLMLKEVGVKLVVTKAVNDLHGRVLEKIGADRVVYPERDMAVRLAHHLCSSNVLDYIRLSPEYGIEEFVVTRKLAGKSLGQINLRAARGLNVIAIKRNGQEVIVSPGAGDILREGDTIVTIGRQEDLEKLEEK